MSLLGNDLVILSETTPKRWDLLTTVEKLEHVRRMRRVVHKIILEEVKTWRP